MPLTFQDASDHIEFVLGDDGEGGLHRAQSVAQFVNEAGHWIVNAHSWLWLRRQRWIAAVPTGQTWEEVPLPPNARTILDARILDTHRRLLATTPEHVEQLRQGSAGTDGTVFYAISARVPEENAGTTPGMVFEVFPTLQSEEQVEINYVAGWPHTTGGSRAPLPIPLHLETLFRAALEAFALGYQDGTVLDRLERIKVSDVFRSAVQRDGAIHRRSLRTRNTTSQNALGTYYGPCRVGHSRPFA